MCEFVSWIERPNGTVKFLTDVLIPKAIEGGIDPQDIAGHEAIRRVFGLNEEDGKERECSNFSSPGNFPAPIVQAILRGQMAGFGLLPQGILRKPLYDD